MKAFRADLQQKSFNARKTNNYEDRINVTYKGMVSENSEEHYKTLAENLEKSVSFWIILSVSLFFKGLFKLFNFSNKE